MVEIKVDVNGVLVELFELRILVIVFEKIGVVSGLEII